MAYSSEDSSFDVPWTGSSDEMKKELHSLASIQKKNLEEFEKLKASIKASLTFEKISPVKNGHCHQLKERFLQQEKSISERLKEYESKYNKLLQIESQLLLEISEEDKSSRQLDQEILVLEERLKDLKKTNKEEKAALKKAQEMYCRTFGLAVNVKEEDRDVFKAFVKFKEVNTSVEFTIHRSSNKILDFKTDPKISEDKIEELRARYKETNNELMLFNSIRTLIGKKAPDYSKENPSVQTVRRDK